ncbi:MAG TPA: alpha/beta fold hydrolase [Polyangiaceae bacterium]|jgi:polyhydroxyalkanoate synthase
MKRLFNLASLLTRKRPPVGATPADVVHGENKWRLLRYRRKEPARFATPVLMVPSLINRHYVLDLLPGKSFVEWLVARGHDVYCIDWGTPSAEDRYLSFDDVCDRYLGRALHKTGKAHVLGYCMGGTLATIHASVHPERFASLTALAAPVRFSEAGMLGVWTQSPQFEPRAVVDGLGNVPWQLLQSSFHMLRPTLNLAKLVALVDRAYDDEFLDGFLAIETWGNDNVSFPGEVWRTWVEELYRGDALVRGTFALSGRSARLEGVTCPLHVVTFEHDAIVPKASTTDLLDRAASHDKHALHLSGGHVGAVVSRGAAKKLWPALADFWAARDGASTARAPRAPSSTPRAPRAPRATGAAGGSRPPPSRGRP